RHDVGHASNRGDFAGYAYALALIGCKHLFWPRGLRAECHEVEHRIRFWLIEIEGYRLAAACKSVPGNFGVYNLSAYGHRVANVLLCIGGGYPRWRGVLTIPKKRQARHTHRHDKGSHSH